LIRGGIEWQTHPMGTLHSAGHLLNGMLEVVISRALYVGLAEVVSQLRKVGLVLGGGLERAVVVGCDTILNDEGLRYDDEFVRHKILDSVGDLYLAGAQIEGHFQGFRSGHSMNHAIVRALFADPSAWRFIDAEDAGLEPERMAVSA